MERQKSNFEPLEITAKMGTSIVVDKPIRFDSLLAYLKATKELLENFNDNIELPIRKVYFQDRYIWDCSNSIIENKKIFKDSLKKQVYSKNLNVKNLNIGGGKYCSMIRNFEVILTDEVKFYCYGNKEEIADLLEQCNFLGKYRKNGYGFISRWEIKRANRRYCFFEESTNLLLRDIPITQDKAMEIIMGDSEKKIILTQGRCIPPYYPKYRVDISYLICEGSVVPNLKSIFSLK